MLRVFSASTKYMVSVRLSVLLKSVIMFDPLGMFNV